MDVVCLTLRPKTGVYFFCKLETKLFYKHQPVPYFDKKTLQGIDVLCAMLQASSTLNIWNYGLYVILRINAKGTDTVKKNPTDSLITDSFKKCKNPWLRVSIISDKYSPYLREC